LQDLRNRSRKRVSGGWDRRFRNMVTCFILRGNELANNRVKETALKRIIDWDLCLQYSESNLRRKVYDTDWRVRMSALQDSINSRSIVRGKITKRQLFDLLEKQQFMCAITGEQLTPGDCSADHIVPVSRGGNHDISNIQLVTKSANRIKGTMTQDELVALARKIIQHADVSD
jgi:5-methylcytosine-specific restriction endonuclease McrA